MGFHTGWGTALDQLVAHVKKLRVKCKAKSGCIYIGGILSNFGRAGSMWSQA